MIKPIRHSSKLVMVILVLLLSAAACKSKKKAMEASNAAAEKARMEQEAVLRKQKQEEEARRKEAEEKSRRDAEAREREANARANSPEVKLGQYFDMISAAGSPTAANGSINEALTLFASPQTPVLIVISESNGQKDYDRPTTIQDYLNYLKDQKKNANKISKLQYDANGKITEVELRKN